MKFLTWNQPLGKPECPYMYRYMLNFGLFSIRLHVWHRSDDKRYLHDHAVDFVTIVLKGSYTDISREVLADRPLGPEKGDMMHAGSIRYRKAEHLHCVYEPTSPTITLLFCGPKRRNWRFWVQNDTHPDGRWFRPLRFFSRYGHPACEEK